MILTHHGINSLDLGGSGGGGTVTIGDKIYRTIIMPDGNEWTVENLDWKFNGCTIGPTAGQDRPRANYYDNDETTYGWDGQRYGLLYNWIAVYELNQMLTDGWTVPTRDDFDNLANLIGSSTAGTQLKSTTHWDSGAGTDTHGFCAYPAGQWNGTNNFYGNGTRAYFWTRDTSGGSGCFRYFNTGTYMESSNDSMDVGKSVRLVKKS